ncbi:MAG: FimB/Mfa2 family fimbrial subunit [Tannerellaceae bacterium]|nr:FimB/Mfa2 family fimbrial subunit [Tannerellaceae bacterium]
MLIGISAAIFPGCIHQDGPGSEDCPADPVEIKVYFSYLDNGENVKEPGIDPTEVDIMRLFVFDEEGLFLQELIDEVPVLTTDYHFTLSLEPGLYHFVAWGGYNENDYDLIPPPLQRAQIHMEEEILRIERTDEVVDVIPHNLFYAGPYYNAQVVTGNEQFTLPLVQDTYTFHIAIDCYDQVGNSLEVCIDDDNGSYHFGNSFVTDSVHYIQSFDINSQNSYTTTVRVMRLSDNRHPRLTFTDNTLGRTLMEVDLVALLQELNNAGLQRVNFDNLYDYNLNFSLCTGEDGDITILVDIDGWHVVVNGTILNPPSN